MIKLIVLDRDGVVNQDSPNYIKTPAEWHALPGSLEAIAKLNYYGYKVVVATNQSGIARALLTPAALTAIHKKMETQIAAAGGALAAIFVCPHLPKDNCQCRKPKPGLLLEAARQFKVEPTELLVIGDSMRDLLAAKACGAAAFLVKTGNGIQTIAAQPIEVPIYSDLAAAAEAVVTKT